MRTVNFEGNKYDYEVIESYMNDEIRERLHSELAPCTEQEFFDRYIEEDPNFMGRDPYGSRGSKYKF